MAERRISGAEVVEGDVDSAVVELPQRGDGGAGLAHQQVFCDLDLEAVGTDPGLFERAFDDGDE